MFASYPSPYWTQYILLPQQKSEHFDLVAMAGGGGDMQG